MSETVEIVINARDNASGVLGGISGGIKSLGNIAATVAKAGLAVFAAGVTAVGTGLAYSLKQAMEAQEGMAQLDAVLKSTGGAAGVTRDMALELADSLSQVTRFSDDAILAGENMLLTFTNIGSEVFPEATQAILDMSTATGQDLTSSAVQLGKALNDPIAGITALTRVGVTFTEEQKDAIASMVEMGDIAGAQTIILDELAKEFGGSAEAAGTTFAGQLDILKNSLDNVAEGVGMALLPILQTLTGFVTENVMPWIIGAGEGLAKLLGIVSDQGWEALFLVFEDGSSYLGAFFETLGLGEVQAQALMQWVKDIKLDFDNLLIALQPVFEAFKNLANAIIASFPQMQAQGAAFMAWFDEAFGITLPTLIENVSGAINALSTLWRQHGDTIMGVVDGAFRVIITVINGAMLLISGIINANLTGWSGDWSGGWEIMRQTLATFFEAALSLVGISMEEFKTSWEGTFELIALAFNTWKDQLLLDFSTWFLNFLGVWQANWDQFSAIVEAIIDNIMGFFSELKQTIGGVIAEVQNLISKILDIPGIPGGTTGGNTSSGHPGTNLTASGITDAANPYASDPRFQTLVAFGMSPAEAIRMLTEADGASTGVGGFAPSPFTGGRGGRPREGTATPGAGNQFILNISGQTINAADVLAGFDMLQQMARM